MLIFSTSLTNNYYYNYYNNYYDYKIISTSKDLLVDLKSYRDQKKRQHFIKPTLLIKLNVQSSVKRVAGSLMWYMCSIDIFLPTFCLLPSLKIVTL